MSSISRVRPGDRLLGLASEGLHTNGYSLARKILFERLGLELDSPLPGAGGSVRQALLRRHRCYRPALAPLVGDGWVNAMAHVTGGGITDNLPRVLPEGCGARVRRASWEVPPLFRFLQEKGRVGEAEMLRTFNMGVGMIAIVPPDRVQEALRRLRGSGEQAFEIGEVVSGRPRVEYA